MAIYRCISRYTWHDITENQFHTTAAGAQFHTTAAGAQFHTTAAGAQFDTTAAGAQQARQKFCFHVTRLYQVLNHFFLKQTSHHVKLFLCATGIIHLLQITMSCILAGHSILPSCSHVSVVLILRPMMDAISQAWVQPASLEIRTDYYVQMFARGDYQSTYRCQNKGRNIITHQV